MTRLIATSVVRGARQGESHGGVYLVDFAEQTVRQTIDWNTTDIDWSGRGWDRGLRGITFADDRVLIAASDEVFAYDPGFRRLGAWRCPRLKHCHEIDRQDERVFLTSTGFDAILAFNLVTETFDWGLRLQARPDGVAALAFDPMAQDGPGPSNVFHLNSVRATPGGLFFAGLRTRGLLRFDGRQVTRVTSLPDGAHNAQPLGEGIAFNDTASDVVRYVTPSKQRTFAVPRYATSDITHAEFDDGVVARQAFARGLCAVSEAVIAAGSSPSTITLYDLGENRSIGSVRLSQDVRNAIHGLEVWPFG